MIAQPTKIPQIVSSFGRHRQLQPPEQTLLDELGGGLNGIDMLDLGVGAGRTAWSFAPRVKSYLGLDYARAMIERCKQDLPAYEFIVGDASKLDFAADNSYDFVLFSYNGIDHLELPDRQRALLEMRRVLRPGGLMAFSSRDANFLPSSSTASAFRLRGSPRATARSLKWAMMFNFLNPTLRFRLPFDVGMVKDGLHSFRSSGICYIRPDLQVEALSQLGWKKSLARATTAPTTSTQAIRSWPPWTAPSVCFRCHKAGRLD